MMVPLLEHAADDKQMEDVPIKVQPFADAGALDDLGRKATDDVESLGNCRVVRVSPMPVGVVKYRLHSSERYRGVR